MCVCIHDSYFKMIIDRIRCTTETFVGYYSCRITRLCLKIKEIIQCSLQKIPTICVPVPSQHRATYFHRDVSCFFLYSVIGGER